MDPVSTAIAILIAYAEGKLQTDQVDALESAIVKAFDKWEQERAEDDWAWADNDYET